MIGHRTGWEGLIGGGLGAGGLSILNTPSREQAIELMGAELFVWRGLRSFTGPCSWGLREGLAILVHAAGFPFRVPPGLITMCALLRDAFCTFVPVRDDPHGPLSPLLLVLTVVTGLVDAVSCLRFGCVFVADMTGNTVFLGSASLEFPASRCLARW